MCLVAIAWKSNPNLPLALIANRDEFHARPTAAAGFDPGNADVYGGRDLQAGGGWLMASRKGRLAAVTNVRAGLRVEAKPLSRGMLVHEFVSGRKGAIGFIDALSATAHRYGRFNLLLWDGDTLRFAGNHPVFSTREVAVGMHAMSNGALDAAWPKTTHASGALAGWLEGRDALPKEPDDVAPLFTALEDATRAPDELLPDTGVGIELERRLSPAFIADPVYGTRCSSVVLVDAGGAIVFAERRFDAGGQVAGNSLQRL